MIRVTVDCTTGKVVEHLMSLAEEQEFERIRGLENAEDKARIKSADDKKEALRQSVLNANSVAQLKAAMLDILEGKYLGNGGI